jgi:hypothetical protein
MEYATRYNPGGCPSQYGNGSGDKMYSMAPNMSHLHDYHYMPIIEAHD